MTPLMLHRTCDLGPIRSVTAKIVPNRSGCDAEFRLEGRLDGIKIPAQTSSVRTDNLWQATCFEIFWQPIGGASYREFNLSPSGQWAAYDFDSFRTGMHEAPIDAIALACTQSQSNGVGELVLKASIAADLPDPAQVALNAVVEHVDGALQYWALAFPPGRPDFHSEACRQWVVER